MALQADFSQHALPTRGATDWSPIDRMLAAKRGSKGLKTRVSQAGEPPRLPELVRAPSCATQTVSTNTQTSSWRSLLSEAVAPEKTRANSLQAEVKKLRSQVAELEEAAARASKEAEERGQACVLLETELASVRQASAAHEEERCQWQEDRRRWQEEVSALRDETARVGKLSASDLNQLERIREELQRSAEECKELRTRCAAMKMETSALTVERDGLLVQLETEQAEMIARVEAMERRMPPRPLVKVVMG